MCDFEFAWLAYIAHKQATNNALKQLEPTPTTWDTRRTVIEIEGLGLVNPGQKISHVIRKVT